MNLSLTRKEVDAIDDPLLLVKMCGGYYECPKNARGDRIGLLVGYADTYGEDKKQYVGDEYINFGKAEEQPHVLSKFARLLYTQLSMHRMSVGPMGLCGAPEGGKALATVIAQIALVQDKVWEYIYPEKRVVTVATKMSRERSDLVFDRHIPVAKQNYWIIEDVCNGFSTTDNLIDLLESYGANVVGIACFLNRSMTVSDFFTTHKNVKKPVISAVRKPMPRYRQEDDLVAKDVKEERVCWKPKRKEEWAKLAPFIKMTMSTK